MNKLIPKYQNAGTLPTDAIRKPAFKEYQIELDRHTDNGQYNPFYDAYTDTYGIIGMPEMSVIPQYKTDNERRQAVLKAEAKRGEQYYHQGMREAQPFIDAVISPLVFMAGMKAPLWAADLAFATSNPDNPISYLPLVGKAGVGGNRALKRGLETAMRTGDGAEVIRLPEYMKQVWNQPGGKSRTGTIVYYTLTGNKMGQKGYYNSFAPDPKHYYSGFRKIGIGGVSNQSRDLDDLIDAVLYGKRIDPKLGLTYIGTGPENYGLHKGYVAKYYPNKKIPVYEVTTPGQRYATLKTVPEDRMDTMVSFYKDIPLENEFGVVDDQGRHIGINVAGHRGELYQSAIDPTQIIEREQDIWKFHPDQFKKRWWANKNSFFTKRGLLKLGNNLGLHLIHQVETPVITRTKWYYNPERLSEYQFRTIPESLSTPTEISQNKLTEAYSKHINDLESLFPYLDDLDNTPESLWPAMDGNWLYQIEPAMRKQKLQEYIDATKEELKERIQTLADNKANRVKTLEDINEYNKAVRERIQEWWKKPAVPLKDVHK